MLAMPRRSLPSSWRTTPTPLPRSPTATTSSTTSSPIGTTPCWLSRRPASAPATCSSRRTVLGRFNLADFEDGTAELGSRVAQHVVGRGVATATVRKVCRLAAARLGLCTLRAATARENAASQKVLTKAEFVPVGPASASPTPCVTFADHVRASTLPLASHTHFLGRGLPALC
jgi:RimJ/RimL family protein N-acetyltransferase